MPCGRRKCCGNMRWVITMKTDKLRADFEKFIGAPPYEHMCGMAGQEAAWPGQYKRFETQLAWEMWCAATERCLAIVGRYRVPVGNSSAGELAREWTLDALSDVIGKIAGVPDDED